MVFSIAEEWLGSKDDQRGDRSVLLLVLGLAIFSAFHSIRFP
jgi:hypothetical protein